MRSFSFALSILLVVGTSQALPQYGQAPNAPTPDSKTPTNPQVPSHLQNLPEGCTIKWKNFNTLVYEETEETVCTPYTENVCVKKERQVCTPYEDEECETKYKDECVKKTRNICNDYVREIEVPYTEDECGDEYVSVCEFHWVVQPNGDKVWEEDKDKCKEVPVTKCDPVQKTKIKSEKYRECNPEEYDFCQSLPYQECKKVTKNSCEQVKYDDCKDVTKTNCVDVHKKVPKTVTERKPIRKCDGAEDVVIKSDDEINQILQDSARSGLEDGLEENPDDDVEVFTFSR